MQNTEWNLLEDNESNPSHEVEGGKSVSLETLAAMTGFPAKMIKKELFFGELSDDEPISLEQLRSHMLGFLNRSLSKHMSDSQAG